MASVYSPEDLSAYIPVFPTLSKRERVCRSILLSYAEEHPEHIPAIQVLVTYPIFKWVCQNSKGSELLASVNRPSYDFCCRLCRSVERAIKSLENPNNLRQHKSFLAVDHVHSLSEPTVLSAFSVTKWYPDGIVRLMEKHAKELSALQAESLNYSISEAAVLSVQNSIAKIHEDGCLDDPKYRRFQKALNCLKIYPKDADDIFPVMKLWLQGEQQEQIYSTLSMSLNTLQRFLMQGTHAMTTLFYGASVEDIVSYLKLAER